MLFHMYQVFCSLQSHRSPSPAPLSPLSLPPSLARFLLLPPASSPFHRVWISRIFRPKWERKKRQTKDKRQKTSKEIKGKGPTFACSEGYTLETLKIERPNFRWTWRTYCSFIPVSFIRSPSQFLLPPNFYKMVWLKNGKACFFRIWKILNLRFNFFRLSFLARCEFWFWKYSNTLEILNAV